MPYRGVPKIGAEWRHAKGFGPADRQRLDPADQNSFIFFAQKACIPSAPVAITPPTGRALP
ncbi:hypothetical protein AZA_34253 [Nitrospirillum viridazoti Y2]|nr:hypothetical protein AZA_34253 [Nitrospirillum amazonense Y2]